MKRKEPKGERIKEWTVISPAPKEKELAADHSWSLATIRLFATSLSSFPIQSKFFLTGDWMEEKGRKERERNEKELDVILIAILFL